MFVCTVFETHPTREKALARAQELADSPMRFREVKVEGCTVYAVSDSQLKLVK